ncbi:hypothetical protein QDY65_02410 [Pyrococcus kukulkanii]|uniref:hypothetical protein n=1 Tax=Pyrococcus kukulkanii TaxID=1609559 RepID=UPI0035672A9A
MKTAKKRDVIKKIHQLDKEDIKYAIKKIDEIGIPEKHKARKYALIYNGKEYPVKYVVSIAGERKFGEQLPTRKYTPKDVIPHLKKFGFEIKKLDDKEDNTPNKEEQIYKVTLYALLSVKVRSFSMVPQEPERLGSL